ncbi:unnamed protein product [Adineta ricciae]|uniref:Uncharacterized protein n=1 Tax=Adineta ricciae TaxID=249248 RepID=A0A813TU50_ADIRI|nr:unnamed protein product [Adineta ricciae]
MATARDSSKVTSNSSGQETAATQTNRYTQIHSVLSGLGLNPSDYTFSPPPENSSPQNSPPGYISAFSAYPPQEGSDRKELLQPRSNSIFTSARPLSYVEQPPAPPPRPPTQSGASILGSLFNPSSSNAQNTTSASTQPNTSFPVNPPLPNTQNTNLPPPQANTSVIASLFNPPSSNTQNAASSLPPPPPPVNTSYPFNSSSFDSRHTSSLPINNMTDCYSPCTPPLPSRCIESSGSAEHYLRQINSCENPPIKVVKPNSQNVCYKKEIRVRYLQPPTPPPPAPIIIREKRIPPPPPQSPLLIRERKPDARTPPPLTIRERPPSLPPKLQPHIIEKCLPPPPPQPRQIIVERLPTPPPKPRTVIFEKWLPYKKVKRPVLLQKAPPPEPIKPVRNVVIEYEPLKAHTVRRVIEEGVFRVDPCEYMRHGAQSNCGDVRFVERIEDLPPPSDQLRTVLKDYSCCDHEYSSYTSRYNCNPYHDLTDHVPSSIQHLLQDARPASIVDQLTNVSRSSSTAAQRPDRVLSTGSNSSNTSPVQLYLQRSHSKTSQRPLSINRLSHHSPNASHGDDIY